jgi:PTS system mannose-specific IIB component
MQDIVRIRIDERLIHGQVATMWQSALSYTRIIIIDDAIAADDKQKTLVRLSCPFGVSLSIIPVEKAAENLKGNKYDGQRIMIIAKGPRPLLALYKAGFKFESITVGNMSGGENKKRLNKSISVTPDDVVIFKELDNLGVKLIVQMVPAEKPSPFMPLLTQV